MFTMIKKLELEQFSKDVKTAAEKKKNKKTANKQTNKPFSIIMENFDP